MGIMDAVNSAPFMSEENEPEIIAVGIVCVVKARGEDRKFQTFTRTYSTENWYHRALGLFHAAVEVIETGDVPDEYDNTNDGEGNPED